MSAATYSSNSQPHPLLLRLLDTVDRIDPDRIEMLWQSAGQTNESLEDCILRSGLASESQIASSYAGHYLVPLFDPPSDDPPPVNPAVATLLPGYFCRDHRIAPLSDDGRTLEVAIFSPEGLLLGDQVKLLTGRQMRAMFAPKSAIERLLDLLYPPPAVTAPPKVQDSSPGTNANHQRREPEPVQPESNPEQRPEETIEIRRDVAGRNEDPGKYVHMILEQAIAKGASDLHLESYAENCRVRMRLDGVLSEMVPPPFRSAAPVVQRIKSLAKLDPSETRFPQSGAIAVRHGNRRIDVRVSTCPIIDGEKVAMRLSENATKPRELNTLGLNRHQLAELRGAMETRRGLVLVTGPSGAGKTSTMYACMADLNNDQTNLCTAEDPVEFRIEGVNQMPVQPEAGWGFASAVRTVLQQDPDVIMVGDIPDHETAHACVRASLGAHLVIAGLHGADVFGGLDRLQAMGIDSFLLASALEAIVAQRLVRRLCDECKLPYQLDQAASERFGIPRDLLAFRPGGCPRCHESGYRGRVGVFSVLRFNQDMKDRLQAGRSVKAIRKAAIEAGMKQLTQAATEKIAAGLTSVEEVLRLCEAPSKQVHESV
jgi:type IV pilus assembly protein PilB